MKTFICSLLFVFISVHTAFSQLPLIEHGPYFVTSFGVKAMYGKNNRLFVTAPQGGPWYTDDRQSWKRPKALIGASYGFAKDANDDLYTYHYRNYIYKSTDNGETWKEYWPIMTDGGPSSPVVFVESIRGIAVTGDSVYVAHNKGLGWLKPGVDEVGHPIHHFDDQDIRALAVHYKTIAVVTVDDSLNISLDHGETWVKKETPFDRTDEIIIVDDKLWINSVGVWYSEDWGDTWEKKDDGIEYAEDIEWSGEKLYAVSDGLYYLSDEDKWVQIVEDEEYSTDVCVATNGSRLFFGRSNHVINLTPGHFFETTDGSTWNDIPLKGYANDIILDIAADSEGNVYGSMTSYLVRKKKDEQEFKIFDQLGYGGILIDNDILYATGGGAFRAYNSKTGERLEVDYPSYTGDAYDSDHIAKSGSSFFISSPNTGIWKVNAGEDFQPFNIGIPSLPMYIRSLAVSGNNVYLVTLTGVYRSGVESSSWQKIFPTDNSDRDVVSIGLNGNTIVVSGMVSHNGGATWTNTNLPNATFYDVSYKDGRFTAVGYDKIYVSNDDGNTWFSSLLGDAPRLYAWSMTISGDKVYIGTSGSGVWSTSTEELEVVTGIEEKPQTFSTVFPNPANDRIIVNTPVDSNIELLDVLGASIERRTSRAGDQQLFQISSLPPGVYLFKIHEGSNLVVKRFVKQ